MIDLKHRRLDVESAEIIRLGIQVLVDNNEHDAIMAIFETVTDQIKDTGHHDTLIGKIRDFVHGETDLSKIVFTFDRTQ